MHTVQGTLKGYDQLLNLVMDETIEYLRGWCGFHCLGVLLSYTINLQPLLCTLQTLRILLESQTTHEAWDSWYAGLLQLLVLQVLWTQAPFTACTYTLCASACLSKLACDVAQELHCD